MKSNLCMLPYFTCTSHKDGSRLLGFSCSSSHRSQTGNSTRFWQCLRVSKKSNMDFALQYMTQRVNENIAASIFKQHGLELYLICVLMWHIYTCWRVQVKTISGLYCLIWFDYLSLKKKVSPLICATASKIIGSLQMSIGVTGPWVGGKGLSVGTPVYKRFTRMFNLWGSNHTLTVH